MNTNLSFQGALEIRRLIDLDPMNPDVSSRLRLISYCYLEHYNKMNHLIDDSGSQGSANEIFFQNFVDVFNIPSRDYDFLLASLNDLCVRLFPYDSKGNKSLNPDTIDSVSDEGVMTFIADKTLQSFKKVKLIYKAVDFINAFIVLVALNAAIITLALLPEMSVWPWIKDLVGTSSLGSFVMGCTFLVICVSTLVGFMAITAMLLEAIKKVALLYLKRR